MRFKPASLGQVVAQEFGRASRAHRRASDRTELCCDPQQGVTGLGPLEGLGPPFRDEAGFRRRAGDGKPLGVSRRKQPTVRGLRPGQVLGKRTLPRDQHRRGNLFAARAPDSGIGAFGDDRKSGVPIAEKEQIENLAAEKESPSVFTSPPS